VGNFERFKNSNVLSKFTSYIVKIYIKKVIAIFKEN